MLVLMIDPVDVSCASDGIAVLTVLASPEHAGRHGACRITDDVSTQMCSQFMACEHTHAHTHSHKTYTYIVTYNMVLYFLPQGEFAEIIYQGGPELVQQCIRPDGKVVMVSTKAY